MGTVIAPRMPSKATTSFMSPEYCKIRTMGFSALFPCFFAFSRQKKQKPRTSRGKSTEVLHRKYGCFASRSPMFWADNTPFSASFALFSMKFAEDCAHFLHPMENVCSKIDSHTLQNAQNHSKIYSKSDAEVCQNFWRFSVGFSLFLHTFLNRIGQKCAIHVRLGHCVRVGWHLHLQWRFNVEISSENVSRSLAIFVILHIIVRMSANAPM